MSRLSARILVSFRSENFQVLIREAQARGISVQELLRAVVVPEWVKENISSTGLPNGTTHSILDMIAEERARTAPKVAQPITYRR